MVFVARRVWSLFRPLFVVRQRHNQFKNRLFPHRKPQLVKRLPRFKLLNQRYYGRLVLVLRQRVVMRLVRPLAVFHMQKYRVRALVRRTLLPLQKPLPLRFRRLIVLLFVPPHRFNLFLNKIFLLVPPNEITTPTTPSDF